MHDVQSAEVATPPRWSTRRILLFLIPLVLFYVYPIGFWPRFTGANETNHAYLAMALYERGETKLDQEVMDYRANQDLTFVKGTFYTNKPPGSGFWLIPAALVIDIFTEGRVELASLCYFGRVLMLTLPFVVFLFFLGRALEKLTTPAVAWGLVLAYGLGSPGCAYATVYFSHNLAAVALGTAFLVLWSQNRKMRLLAGLACGFAVLCEYQTVVIAAVLTVVAALDERRKFNPKLLLSFLIGALPMAALLLAYNSMSFGASGEVGYVSEFKSN